MNGRVGKIQIWWGWNVVKEGQKGAKDRKLEGSKVETWKRGNVEMWKYGCVESTGAWKDGSVEVSVESLKHGGNGRVQW